MLKPGPAQIEACSWISHHFNTYLCAADFMTDSLALKPDPYLQPHYLSCMCSHEDVLALKSQTLCHLLDVAKAPVHHQPSSQLGALAIAWCLKGSARKHLQACTRTCTQTVVLASSHEQVSRYTFPCTAVYPHSNILSGCLLLFLLPKHENARVQTLKDASRVYQPIFLAT